MAIGPFWFTFFRYSNTNANSLLSLVVPCTYISTKLSTKAISSSSSRSSHIASPLLILLRFASSASLSHARLLHHHQRSRQVIATQDTLAQKIGKSIRRPGAPSKSRVYPDVNVVRPKEYWEYESLTVQWG